MIPMGFAIARVYLSDYSTSDNGRYGNKLAVNFRLRRSGFVIFL